jgi:hypothetical protein
MIGNQIGPDLFVCKWCDTYHWKDLDEGYNFALDLISIRGLQKKLWASKIVEVPIWEFRNSNLGVPGQNDIWVQAPWSSIENTIRGKVHHLPPSPGHGEFCESVFARGSFVHKKCSNYALTNLLFGLCRFVWVIELLIILLGPHPRTLARPSTPKVLRVRECTPTPSPSVVFTFGFTVESIKESRECINIDSWTWCLTKGP